MDELVPFILTFVHGNEADMRGYLGDTSPRETMMYVQRRVDDDRVVGMTLAKISELHYKGEDLLVCRLGLIVDPNYRGNNFVLRHLMRALPQATLWYPRRTLYLLATLIHPVTYKLACNLLRDRMYPYYGLADEAYFGRPELKELLEFSVEAFGIEKSESENPILYKDLFYAKETPEEQAYWHNHPHPAIHFYLQNLPDYDRNDCLIMLAPLELPYLVRTMVKTLTRARLRRLRRGLPEPFRKSASRSENRTSAATENS